MINPLKLCDINGRLLHLGQKVTVQWQEFSLHDPRTFRTGEGVITEFHETSPWITINLNREIPICNGSCNFKKMSFNLLFCHFSKTSDGQWIASQMMRHHDSGNVPLFVSIQ